MLSFYAGSAYWGNGCVEGMTVCEESGEERREIWQQRSAGVAGREYLSGWHSNAVSINVPGHLLNQASAGRLEDIQPSPSSSGHAVPQKHWSGKKTQTPSINR